MRARVGKIARLPGELREELNRRLHHGELGKHLAAWLNALPQVRLVLSARFAGRPITEENISEWRRGGHQDWLRERERRDRLRELAEQDQSLGPEERTSRLTALTEHRLAVELAEELERISARADGDERRKRLHYLIHGICRLQDARNRRRHTALLEKTIARQPSQLRDSPATSGSLWDLLGPNGKGASSGE